MLKTILPTYAILFYGIAFLFWKPLPLVLTTGTHGLMLTAGLLIYFPGLAFALWGRLALGRMYFVSTSLGAQLYADHQLITSGSYAIVRHPMYLRLIAADVGSCCFTRPGLLSRLRSLLHSCFYAPTVRSLRWLRSSA